MSPDFLNPSGKFSVWEELSNSKELKRRSKGNLEPGCQGDLPLLVARGEKIPKPEPAHHAAAFCRRSSAGFQPAVSQASSLQPSVPSTRPILPREPSSNRPPCRLEVGDT